jgi:hypothetical protein
MPSIHERESSLIDQYLACFEKLDETTAWDTDPVASHLAVGEIDQYGFKHWRPAKVRTDAKHLQPLYSKLPARFPPLFERLILSYRWAEIDLQSYRLLANPPGPDLSGLFAGMSKDLFLWDCLIRSGYIRFGLGPDIDYDPVCFDISSRKKNRDCRIVKIDHEEILCNNRIKVVAELAKSFQQLVENTVELANRQHITSQPGFQKH